jgi:hypothetical protein
MALTQAQIDQLREDSAVLTADAAGTDAQLVWTIFYIGADIK